ncbi:PA14 domain-containing protein [Streptomyces ossamyceticus]|uniref:PA14 domain-containing protein n=1 Tax=Streptomyces ossamyceticus TaxID=249581 RepID=A0ABV2UWZ3_9ACTN
MATVIAAAMGGVYALTAQAAVTCAPSVFKRQMFANTSFSGTPLTTDCDSAIDQDWGTDAPAPGLPDDRFGVRWSVTRDFGSGGPFILTASGRDGDARVYVDGRLWIDLRGSLHGDVPAQVSAYGPTPESAYGPTPVSKSVDVAVPPGRHTLRVDYVNRSGAAEVAFTAVPLSRAGAVIPPSPR